MKDSVKVFAGQQRRGLSTAGRRWWLVIGLAACAALAAAVAGCRPGPGASQPESQPAETPVAGGARLPVVVSILPQAYFVQRVGGAHVDVHVLVGPGQSPATYEPTPKQMKALAQARILFRIGVPFENSLLPKIQAACPRLEICDTRAGIKLRRMAAHTHNEHEHGPEHTAGDDPHIWLAPQLVKQQARTIADTLARLDPPHAAEYQDNLAAFAADLEALDQRLAATLAPLKGRTFFVFHPAYGYFADAYGLRQVPVELEGKEPTPQELVALIKRAKQAQARVIFVQPEFSSASAAALARGIDGAVVPLDPLARDCLQNMEEMAARVQEALSGE